MSMTFLKGTDCTRFFLLHVKNWGMNLHIAMNLNDNNKKNNNHEKITTPFGAAGW